MGSMPSALRNLNLLRRLLAEGAMSTGFIPVLSEYRAKGDGSALRSQLFRLSLLLMVVVGGLGAFGAGVIVAFLPGLGVTIAPESAPAHRRPHRWMFPSLHWSPGRRWPKPSSTPLKFSGSVPPRCS